MSTIQTGGIKNRLFGLPAVALQIAVLNTRTLNTVMVSTGPAEKGLLFSPVAGHLAISKSIAEHPATAHIQRELRNEAMSCPNGSLAHLGSSWLPFANTNHAT